MLLAKYCRCHPQTGKCFCKDGYTGYKCSTKCSNNTFGEDCRNSCECVNGDCNHVTGTCTCSPGFTGNLCDRPCRSDYYGDNCSSKCLCE